ncbi:MAG: hypothetical protein PVH19_03880 [Planctomycetia bacterium]|jgi:hypothetical protein
MKSLSKNTIIAFFFLFLGTIELIFFGTPREFHNDTIGISFFLLISGCVHVILGYGFILLPALARYGNYIANLRDDDQEPSTENKKDPS